MIHNVFNKDLLTRCVEPKFKGQHKEPAPPLTIINEEEEYEVEEVQEMRMGNTVFSALEKIWG